MPLKIAKNSVIRKVHGHEYASFVEYASDSFDRLLPHISTNTWRRLKKVEKKASCAWKDERRRSLIVRLRVASDSNEIVVFEATLSRRKTPEGVGSIERTLQEQEFDICKDIVANIQKAIDLARGNPYVCRSIQRDLDELSVAEHLQKRHKTTFDPFSLFAALHQLAEETYENKQVPFGCVIDSHMVHHDVTKDFPRLIRSRKRFKALSDGFKTAYILDSQGSLKDFVDLDEISSAGASAHKYFPEWSEPIAKASKDRWSICLNRNGDLLVFDDGTLYLSYRFGRWQFWNHRHLIDLLTNRMRVQHVLPTKIGEVARSIYRVALDVSFRRTGGLFVVLKNKNRLYEIVRHGDAIGDPQRQSDDVVLDRAIQGRKVFNLPRSVLAEIAALDGAVVLSNDGTIRAYGAVLNPKRTGKAHPAEGSRTKAAIGASNCGLALKISSDGGMTVYSSGKVLVEV